LRPHLFQEKPEKDAASKSRLSNKSKETQKELQLTARIFLKKNLKKMRP